MHAIAPFTQNFMKNVTVKRKCMTLHVNLTSNMKIMWNWCNKNAKLWPRCIFGYELWTTYDVILFNLIPLIVRNWWSPWSMSFSGPNYSFRPLVPTAGPTLRKFHLINKFLILDGIECTLSYLRICNILGSFLTFSLIILH